MTKEKAATRRVVKRVAKKKTVTRKAVAKVETAKVKTATKKGTESTESYYQRDFKNMTTWMKDNKLKAKKDGSHIVKYMSALAEGYPNGKKKAKQTQRRYLSAIKHMYKKNEVNVNYDLVADYFSNL